MAVVDLRLGKGGSDCVKAGGLIGRMPLADWFVYFGGLRIATVWLWYV
jgi:hypothetical protein